MSSSVAASLVNEGMSELEALNKAQLFDTVERQLSPVDGSEVMRWFVPGRIEVLGKHTDYGGGRSLLCTAERGFCVAAVHRSDSLVRINDVIRRQSFEFTMSPEVEVPDRGWTVYPAVVARRLARNFPGAGVWWMARHRKASRDRTTLPGGTICCASSATNVRTRLINKPLQASLVTLRFTNSNPSAAGDGSGPIERRTI